LSSNPFTGPLRTLFSPLLSKLEAGDDPYAYKPSHRFILIFMSCLFLGLAIGVYVFMPETDPGYWFPVVVFGGAGLTGLITGLLGKNRAVAKLWGSR